MKYQIKPTNKFKKDLKLAKKQHKDLKELFNVIDILKSGSQLDQKYNDHPLSGNFLGKRECHLAPDFILIYEKNENILYLYLIRLGTHSNLFKK